uniref:Mobile element protein n=1 Tax=Angiostrongylus cantonensis TaxID=6313 RepID=A0A0K0CYT3_ANGCA
MSWKDFIENILVTTDLHHMRDLEPKLLLVVDCFLQLVVKRVQFALIRCTS